jgi:hypothetical protein
MLSELHVYTYFLSPLLTIKSSIEHFLDKVHYVLDSDYALNGLRDITSRDFSFSRILVYLNWKG